MELPSWDLAIPSPLSAGANSNLADGEKSSGCSGLKSFGSTGFTYTSKDTGSLQNVFSLGDPSPQSTSVAKMPKTRLRDNCGISLGSDAIHELNQSPRMDNKLKRTSETLKVFIPARCTATTDLAELHLSVYATIDRTMKTYVCIHDLVSYVSKKALQANNQIKWRHVKERNFLFTFADKQTKEKFVATQKTVRLGDCIVKFKPWKQTVGSVKSPCRFKVWLKLSGLPIELFTFGAAELVVCSFGRLHRCNFEKKKTYIGAFYVMIDCADIDAIEPRVEIQPETDLEMPVFISKMYACSLDVYENQKFSDSYISFDDIIVKLIDRGILIAL